MKGYSINIQEEALENNNFRKVLSTTKNMQLVIMSLEPNQEIGLETHPQHDQFFRFEGGHGKCMIDEDEYLLESGDIIIIPQGTKYNIINLSMREDLKLSTIYTVPHYKEGIIHKTKEIAQKAEEEGRDIFDR